MADPTAILNFLLTAVTTIYDRVGQHRIARTDIIFSLERYRTYATDEARRMIDQGLREPSCNVAAQRLFSFHAAVGDWLKANNFKALPGNNIKVPRLYLDVKAKSFKEIVEIVAKETDRLEDRLRDVPGGLLRAPPAINRRPQIVDPNSVHQIVGRIRDTTRTLGVTVPAAWD